MQRKTVFDISLGETAFFLKLADEMPRIFAYPYNRSILPLPPYRRKASEKFQKISGINTGKPTSVLFLAMLLIALMQLKKVHFREMAKQKGKREPLGKCYRCREYQLFAPCHVKYLKTSSRYRNPYHSKWTEEYQAEALEKQITAVLNHPDCIGVYIWQFCDIRVSDEWFGIRGIVDEFRRPKLCYEAVKKHFSPGNP